MKSTAILIIMASLNLHSGAQQTVPSGLVEPGASLEKAGTGYAFTEGSSVAPDGSVFFTDQPNDRIYVWNEATGISLFKEGTERANGTAFDNHGNLIACADLHNSLVRFNTHGIIQILYSGGYAGNHLNGPNDLWIDKKGGIYFTDPYYHRNYWDQSHRMMQDVQAVYYLSPAGQLTRVIDDMKQPNGIAGTGDGNYLFVADIASGQTYRYAIGKDGSLSGKTLFAPAGSDGMTVDENGNVYLTYGTVRIFNSEGESLGEIVLPESPSNLCFGGKKRNILFITARTSVYTLRMKVRGAE